MRSYPVDPISFAAVRTEVEGLALKQLPVGAGHPGDDHPAGWIQGFANTRLVEWDHNADVMLRNELIVFPAIASEIGKLMKHRGASGLYQVMVNRLDPGGSLDRHRDPITKEPAPERWHLPIVTNPLVEYWQRGFDHPVHLSLGSWWGPIEYWNLHNMVNLGETSRIHLLVDLIR